MKIRTALMYCLFLASAFCLLAAAHNDHKTTGKKIWPTRRDQEDRIREAVESFTATLTRSGYDRHFRNRLTASCDSAKQAVSEEGNIDVPDNVITMFYEPGTSRDHFGFALPPFNHEGVHKPYKYADRAYHKCCFPIPNKFVVQSIDPALASALDAAMTHAGYDSEFRKRLTASCDSAKKAVSEEGHVQIKEEVRMIFQDVDKDAPADQKAGDRYHIFELPPFDATSHKQHDYVDGFRGLYPVWPPKPPG